MVKRPSGVRIKIGPTGAWSETKREDYGWSPALAEWIADTFVYAFGDGPIPHLWDLGCGAGDYLEACASRGYFGMGIEGAPIHGSKRTVRGDITIPLDVVWLEGATGTVICLEVLEHIPDRLEREVLDNIARACSRRLICSWAIPGQPGDGHVNCRTNDDAIARIEAVGFALNRRLTYEGRSVIKPGDPCPWFKNTLMVFDRRPDDSGT